MVRQLTRFALAIALLLGAVSAWAELVTYPRHQGDQDPQIQYMLEVLRLALTKSGHQYELRQASTVMVQSRAISELAANTGSVDVIWTMTNLEREAQLLPVRIPVDRGLIGWRVALIQSQQPGLLSQVKDLAGLARLRAGQMHDWPDTDILRGNGLAVEPSSTYEGLFKQLATQRIDYFPRSVMEVRNELKAHESLPINIDQTIMLRYPAAFYFFVSPKRPQLAADLTKGLEAALADGSFLKLFRQHLLPLLDGLQLDKRRVIELKNPGLPPQTPISRRALWFELDELKSRPAAKR